jgi:uncharacterized membrane protein
MADENSQAGASGSQPSGVGEGAHAHKRLLHGVPGNERIGAFSDGVFAIAITLLVVGLVEVPVHAPEGGLITMVPDFLPRLAGHVITFAVLGIYWVGHHNMFMHIKRHDRTLLWLNNLFLLFVAIMPLPTALIAEHGDDQVAVIAYAGTLVLAGVSLDLIWRYATHKNRLVSPGIDPGLVTFVHGRVLLAPAVYLLAIVVSFFSITAAKLLFVIVTLLYIVPNRLDQYHHRQLQGPASGHETS